MNILRFLLPARPDFKHFMPMLEPVHPETGWRHRRAGQLI